MKRVLFLMLFISPLTHADELTGRLFYTPAERAQLEAGRKHPAPPAADSPAPAPTPDTLYNGYVQRSDGRVTQWINGAPQPRQAAPGRPGMLKLPATPALKPGQEYDSGTGQILEPYQRVTPVPSAPEPAAPVTRKAPRNTLLDGDDVPDDSRNDAR